MPESSNALAQYAACSGQPIPAHNLMRCPSSHMPSAKDTTPRLRQRTRTDSRARRACSGCADCASASSTPAVRRASSSTLCGFTSRCARGGCRLCMACSPSATWMKDVTEVLSEVVYFLPGHACMLVHRHSSSSEQTNCKVCAHFTKYAKLVCGWHGAESKDKHKCWISQPEAYSPAAG